MLVNLMCSVLTGLLEWLAEVSGRLLESSSRRLSVGRLTDQKQSKAESITGSQVDEPTFFVVIMCLDNCLVGHLGGLGPYPTVSPPSSLVSSVADSANLEVGFARQSFQVYDLTRFLDCVSSSFILTP